MVGGIFGESLTPAMVQYKSMKQKYPDCLLLFRMGDFYEMFYEDAVTASRVLGIALTSRGKGEKKAPLAGIPYKSASTYMRRLIQAGFKLAVAEQTEDPRQVKGRIVERDVVRVITPGTLTDEEMLDSTGSVYISSVFSKGNINAIAWAEVSTGEFLCLETKGEGLFSEIKKLSPAECVIPESMAVSTELLDFLTANHIFISRLPDTNFAAAEAERLLREHFAVSSLRPFGIQDKPHLISAAGGLLAYLKQTQRMGLAHISTLRRLGSGTRMRLDATTIRNLELFRNILTQEKKGTLLWAIDRCSTPMGERLLRGWLQAPLLDIKKINRRQEAIAALSNNTILRAELSGLLKGCCDLERAVGKLGLSSAGPRDIASIGATIRKLPQILKLCAGVEAELINCISKLPDCHELAEKIEKALTEDPPARASEGGIIRTGYSRELDELRELKESSREVLKRLEKEEIERTGIKTLRLGFNQIIGYYIQVSKSQLGKVPQNYIKKQSLLGGERFVTQELKELEARILGAEERISALELELFNELVKEVCSHSRELQRIARGLALLDVLCGLAEIASTRGYCRPKLNEGGSIRLVKSRHPVVESMGNFIPNDAVIEKHQMIILTGPNMAGKSTFMRQVCLCCILAQIGSFVPAESAEIGIIDGIFIRVGAYDDLAHGQSTFMVEMEETANILNSATENSLIVLDEIGRGTSTFDGVALAWAVAEHIHNRIRAKTIFATHYHVLNKLSEEFKNIKNFNIAVKEEGDSIIFLRKIVEGGTDKSYGIHVARLAGMPSSVVQRALEIQAELLEEDKMIGRLKGSRDPTQITLKKWER